VSCQRHVVELQTRAAEKPQIGRKPLTIADGHDVADYHVLGEDYLLFPIPYHCAIHGHQLIESHDHFLMVIFLQIEHNAREKEKNEQNDARHQKLGIHLAMDGRVNFKYVVYGKTGDGTQKYHDAQDAEAVLYELPKAHILFEGKR